MKKVYNAPQIQSVAIEVPMPLCTSPTSPTSPAQPQPGEGYPGNMGPLSMPSSSWGSADDAPASSSSSLFDDED